MGCSGVAILTEPLLCVPEMQHLPVFCWANDREASTFDRTEQRTGCAGNVTCIVPDTAIDS